MPEQYEERLGRILYGFLQDEIANAPERTAIYLHGRTPYDHERYKTKHIFNQTAVRFLNYIREQTE